MLTPDERDAYHRPCLIPRTPFGRPHMTGRLVTLDLHHAEALENFLVDFDANPSELHAYFCDRNATIETAARELQDWADGFYPLMNPLGKTLRGSSLNASV